MESTWRKAHWEELKKLAGFWIAYDPEGEILGNAKNLSELLTKFDESHIKPTYYFVHPAHVQENYPARFLAIYFKAVRKNLWRPFKKIEVISSKKSISLDFLVDSGADFSLIDFKTGLSLGFTRTDDEKIYVGEAAGGVIISYLLRDIKMNIDGHIFPVTVAWLLDESKDELLLGREIVFDLFDIEFKQADEQILFKWRDIKV